MTEASKPVSALYAPAGIVHPVHALKAAREPESFEPVLLVGVEPDALLVEHASGLVVRYKARYAHAAATEIAQGTYVWSDRGWEARLSRKFYMLWVRCRDSATADYRYAVFVLDLPLPDI